MLYQMKRIERTGTLPTGIQYLSKYPKEQIIRVDTAGLASGRGLGSMLVLLALTEISPLVLIPTRRVIDHTGDQYLCPYTVHIDLPAITTFPDCDRPAIDVIVTERSTFPEWRRNADLLGLDPRSTFWFTEAYWNSAYQTILGEVFSDTVTKKLSKRVRRVVIDPDDLNRDGTAFLESFPWNRVIMGSFRYHRPTTNCNFFWYLTGGSVFLPVWTCSQELILASKPELSLVPHRITSSQLDQPDPDSEAGVRMMYDRKDWVALADLFKHLGTVAEIAVALPVDSRETIERLELEWKGACSICYNKISCPIMTICCKHVICFDCITRCIGYSSQCPLCRASLSSTNQLCLITREPVASIVCQLRPVSFRSMPVLDIILRILRRIATQVVDPRVLVMCRCSEWNENDGDYGLAQYMQGRFVDRPCYPAALARRHYSSWVDVYDGETYLSDNRSRESATQGCPLAIVSDVYQDRAFKFLDATHLIVVSDKAEAIPYAIAMATIAPHLGEEYIDLPVLFWISGTNLDQGGLSLVDDLGELHRVIYNPHVAALDAGLSD